MNRQGRTHLFDPSFWRTRGSPLAVIAVVLGGLAGLAVVGPSPTWRLVARALLALITFAFIAILWRTRREAALWRSAPKTRVEQQQKQEALLALERSRPALDAELWSRWLQTAESECEFETMHAIATCWLATPNERPVYGDRARTTLVALAYDALACVATGDASTAAAQLARHDAFAREHPAAANHEQRAHAVASLARAWIDARDGRAAEASAIASAWRTEIGALPSPLGRIARSMRAPQEAPATHAAPYRDGTHPTRSALHWQRTYPFIEVANEAPIPLEALPSLTPHRSLRPLPLPPPHPKSPASTPRTAESTPWGYLAAAVALLAMLVGAVALRQPLVGIGALVGMFVLAQDYRQARGADRVATRPASEDQALLFDAIARSKTDRAEARAALESIAARGSGIAAASAAQRLAAIVELEGDAAGALQWHEHALATLHHESAADRVVYDQRFASANARAILLAANGRYDEAERALRVLPHRDPNTMRSTAFVRLTRMTHDNDVTGARALWDALPERWVPEGWTLLRDALFAEQDPELARDVAARVAAWPDGLGFLRTISPAHAAKFAPSIRVAATTDDALDERDPGATDAEPSKLGL